MIPKVKQRLWILNGTGGVGKNCFVDFVAKELEQYPIFVKDVSSVELIKKSAFLMGWDGVKDEKGRKFLSDLKDISTELYEGPMKFMESRIKDFPNDVLFFMIREPQEIKKFVEKYPETKTIGMTRPDHFTTGNHADENVHMYNYDYVIVNDGELDAFERCAIDFTNKEILQK